MKTTHTNILQGYRVHAYLEEKNEIFVISNDDEKWKERPKQGRIIC